MSNSEQNDTLEQHAFQTEIQQLLELMIHSLYTHEEIFLRELVSNASDALNKIQFEQLTNSDVVSADAQLTISIIPNLDDGTLVIEDTGVGMTREEMSQNLGTIARSGSKAFLNALKAQGKDGLDQLIGQFGVGFYSAFMVADKVTVESRSYIEDEKSVIWTSEGKGTYTIEDGSREARGTRVTLYLKDDAKKYLETYEIEQIVKKYSDYVSYPINLADNTLNRQKALWLTRPSEVEEAQYHEFYGHLSNDTREPLKHMHLHFEAPLQFDAILYIPPTAPDPMAWEDRDTHHVQLFARRVFIQESCKDLVPSYLRFLVGVVDSADIPLNVSRETVQNNPIIGNIKKNIVRKVLGLLKTMAKKDEEEYLTFYREFSRYLKQGYTEDFSNQDKLRELLRFNSSNHSDIKGLTSLKNYIERMQEGQEKIYYANGDSREAIERSPNLELLKEKGFEVLYMSDHIDGILMGWLTTYDEKTLVNVDSADLDLKRAENDASEEAVESTKDLAGFVKNILGDKIEDVRISDRLVSSPVCLVNPDNAMSSDLQRVYRMMDKNFTLQKKILELNPNAPLIQNLGQMFDQAKGDESKEASLRPWAEQLFDIALLAEGLHPDPAAMVPRMQALMTQAASAMSGTASIIEETPAPIETTPSTESDDEPAPQA